MTRLESQIVVARKQLSAAEQKAREAQAVADSFRMVLDALVTHARVIGGDVTVDLEAACEK